MSFRKTLGIITIFVVSVFVLMLSSSYAWYSFNNASTAFNIKTSDEDINVMYKSSKFISTVTAVPISSNDVSKLAEKNNFSIEVNNDEIDEALSVSVGLTSVEIDGALRNNNFRYDLLYNGNSVAKGNFSDFFGDSLSLVDGIILDNLGENNFELRIYLLDDGNNQNDMMNKTFKAIISVNVVSRVNVTLDNQDVDLLVKNIVIDGKESNYLPSKGRYSMSAVCENGSDLKWNSLKKTLVFSAGSVINDRCSLTFRTSSDVDNLSDIVKTGDYIKYLGINGCSGYACEGININYVDDTNMGYCTSFNNKYTDSGWRVMYVLDGTVYLVSAGALECVDNTVDLDKASLKYCNNNFVYGNECNFDSVRVINDDDFKKMIGNDLNSCNNSKSNKKCGYNNDLIDNGGYYWYASNGNSLFSWNPTSRSISNDTSVNYMGLRPVIRLNSNVKAISGNGTYNDPYVIDIK